MARRGLEASRCVWLIAGPTASGKSGLALALAERTGAEIVNADSMQVYRDLSCLTARPGPAETGLAPHHLYGVADGADAWSVGRWLRAAEDALADIAQRGRPAIVVGGTGLYFRALTEGLSVIPQVSPATRDACESDFAAEGEAGFRARLQGLDPLAEARIAAGDRQRLVRAMSVWLETGRPLSAWQGDGAVPAVSGWSGLVLDPPRAELYEQCEARLRAMVQAGALDEVRALTARGLDPALPVMKALGVAEFAAHLDGRLTLAEALAGAGQATRRYAKRQTTWFRNQTPAWPRLASADPAAAGAILGLTP